MIQIYVLVLIAAYEDFKLIHLQLYTYTVVSIIQKISSNATDLDLQQWPAANGRGLFSNGATIPLSAERPYVAYHV